MTILPFSNLQDPQTVLDLKRNASNIFCVEVKVVVVSHLKKKGILKPELTCDVSA